MVTSSQNAQVRFIKSLKKRKLREEAGCFFIEGLRSVCEGIISGADIKTLVLSESFIKSEFYAELKKALDSAEKFSVESVLFPVSDAIYAQLTDLETPQGIGAVFSIKALCCWKIFRIPEIWVPLSGPQTRRPLTV